MKHNRNSYINKKCRCKKCSKANRIYQLKYLHKRIKLQLVDGHGKRLTN